ncbi:helix-turn-helix domain-containing protein [Sphingomonas nostoxanthinifaciens]|uniref:helix-turn-helix domain-containing protein n=1 Tax=Sphingomonas nostoxanthinifaciens TaxID=2872652 RepID=UPI001CC1EDAC|nr:helix-turn-helix domain-containing protein [Sphingomonas nostoxanthinifaciens]UAK24911.1 DUF4115 domain-containing protein [Sphingomonas nostoxanthinifaciens]
MSDQGEAGAFDERVGDRLRAAREAEGLELTDVAQRTRIPIRHLAAIEEGDYSGLPAATYSAGFVKSYARLLGLDGQRLSQDFREEMGGATVVRQNVMTYEPADPHRTPPAGLALVVLLIAIVAGLGYLYWRGSQSEAPTELAATSSDRPATPPVAATTPAPQPAAPAPAAPAIGGPVVIGATQDVWIKVEDSGKTLFMGLLKTSDHFEVPATAVAPMLTTGRPGVTTITVGATPIPPVGDPDRAAKNVSLKADALLARVATPAPATQPPADAPTPVDNGAN